MKDREPQESAGVESQALEFIGIISHELGTDLTLAKGAADLLARDLDNLGRGEILQLITDIRASTERMSQKLKNLIALERQAVEVEPNLINRLAAKTIGEFCHLSGREVIPHGLENKFMVLCNASNFGMILGNLLTNADKYSPKDTPITVRIEEEAGEIKVCVSDLGDGIEPGDLKQIFKPGFRTNSAKKSDAKGLGLGLAICKRLTEAQNGRIWAQREDGVTTFSFTLPKVEIAEE